MFKTHTGAKDDKRKEKEVKKAEKVDNKKEKEKEKEDRKRSGTAVPNAAKTKGTHTSKYE